MKPANQPASGADDTLITGVREAASLSPAELSAELKGSSEPTETLSGRPRPAQESWPLDDEAESELPVPAGTLLNGKYTVDRMFAEGGMGIVCLGRHVQLEQQVAIKFLRRALSGRSSIVQRFLNEARALASLRSEHVVRVMDVGQLESGRPYLVMEHLDGIDLEALLERDGPLSVKTAVSYALQICEPLAEAHALGIVHRDIKPENLFLWSGGPAADSVKVLDFGLAKQMATSRALGVTGPQDSLGSPGYMSPEQVATPQLVDARTDIWSLGVVLYRLLTNVSPFDGGSLVEVLSHILNAAPVPMAERTPAVDAKLDAIVLRCLEKSPEARYQTMSQLGDALSDYLGGREQSLAEPASSPRSSSARRARNQAKIKIPGVHSRWPTVLPLLLVLLAAATYAAERSGRIRARDLSDGWLTPARMAGDPPLPLRDPDYQQAAPFSRAVLPGDVARAPDGRAAPRAFIEPERLSDAPPLGAAAAEPSAAPLGETERARRDAAYSDYLKNEGLTPLSDVPAASGSSEDPAP